MLWVVRGLHRPRVVRLRIPLSNNSETTVVCQIKGYISRDIRLSLYRSVFIYYWAVLAEQTVPPMLTGLFPWRLIHKAAFELSCLGILLFSARPTSYAKICAKCHQATSLARGGRSHVHTL